MKDARKIGRKLFPVHRYDTVWFSAALKVWVRLEFRPLRTCRVCRPGSIGISIELFISSEPASSPSTTASYVPRRTSTPIALCVSFSIAAIVHFLILNEDAPVEYATRLLGQTLTPKMGGRRPDVEHLRNLALAIERSVRWTKSNIGIKPRVIAKEDRPRLLSDKPEKKGHSHQHEGHAQVMSHTASW